MWLRVQNALKRESHDLVRWGKTQHSASVWWFDDVMCFRAQMVFAPFSWTTWAKMCA
jgi:hypothetical protein